MDYRIKLSLVSLLALLCCGVLSQNYAITPPYQCGFEDPAENALWELNVGRGDQCTDKWYVGSAAFNEGSHALYISDNGGIDARFGSQPNVTVVKRRFTIPDGGYEVSFDWRNLALENSGLYVCLYSPPAISPDSDPSTASIPQWLQRSWKKVTVGDGSSTTCMAGKLEWDNASFTFNVAGGRTMELAFAWVNANTDTTVFNPLAACIDNIQISSTKCRKPYDLNASLSCDSVVLTWDGTSTHYVPEYKKNENTFWVKFSPQEGKECIIRSLDEGVYDFRVRSLNIVDGDTVYGAYASKYSQLIFCPEKHCLNYVDLDDPKIRCFTGRALGAQQSLSSFKREKVDFGATEAVSRHTVNWNKNLYDPRTGNKLKIVPDEDYATIRLGNWLVGGEAERIEFNFTVDTTDAAILLLKYAIVQEDPIGHQTDYKPYFSLTILDKLGEKVDPSCGEASFYADMYREGWHVFDRGTDAMVVWKDWTTMGLNLGPYHGQTITIRLETQDCVEQGHFGYAYFTLNCAAGEIESMSCGDSPIMEIKAPDGFDYEWYSSKDPTKVLDTAQILAAEMVDDTEYKCKCMFKENHACHFTLSTVVSPRYPYAELEKEWVPAGCRNVVQFKNLSHIINIDKNDNVVHTDKPCETVKWIFNGNDVRTEMNPAVVMPGEGGTLDYMLITGITNDKCLDTIQGTMEVPSIVSRHDTIIDTICSGQPYSFGGVTYYRSDTVVYEGINVAGCDSITTLFLTALPRNKDVEVTDTICFGETYYVGNYPFTEPQTKKEVLLKNRFGCDSTVVLTLVVMDEVTFSVSATNEADNPGSGSITITDAPENYTYSVNGEPGGPLTGLKGGTYTIIVYDENGCPSAPAEVIVESECLEVDIADNLKLVACADDRNVSVPFSVIKGYISGYDLVFDQKALKAGFSKDSSHMAADTLISLALPEMCRPDIYTAALIFKDVICDEILIPVSIEIHYPQSIIAQKWNDVLAVQNAAYNGGYEFSAFQWYRNGSPMEGEVHPYYYSGQNTPFNAADVYHAVLTRADDGVSIPTCPVAITQRTDVSAYPIQTVVPMGAPLKITGTDAGTKATARIYNAAGQLCAEAEISAGISEMAVPQTAGVYILYIDCDGNRSQHRIIVR